MNLRNLLRRMEIILKKKEKKEKDKKRGLEGPPVDKMLGNNEERTFIVKK